MAHYVRETHSYDDGGFTTMGRVVAVLSHSPHNNRVTVLVEKSPQVSFEKVPDEVSSEGVTLDEIAEKELADEQPTCAGKGGECSRRVDEPGDRCWQHEDE